MASVTSLNATSSKAMSPKASASGVNKGGDARVEAFTSLIQETAAKANALNMLLELSKAGALEWDVKTCQDYLEKHGLYRFPAITLKAVA